MHNKRRCDGTCGRLINTRGLYKKDDKEYCTHCIRKFRKKIPNLGFLNTTTPPRNVVEGQYWRKPKIEKPSKEKTIVPIIRGAKKARSFIGSRYSHLYFTRVERIILYKKYVSNGLTEDQARKRLDNAINYMKDFIEKLKMKGVEEKEINKRFKEEFSKLVEKQ